MDERQKLIAKINSLLQLAAKNPNQAEAQATQNKAFKLMSDNNIAMSEVIMPGTELEKASEYKSQEDYEYSRQSETRQAQWEAEMRQKQERAQQEAFYRQQAEQAAYERMRAEQAAYQRQQEQQRMQSQAVPKPSGKEMIIDLLIFGTVVIVICYALFPTFCKFIVFAFCLALGLYVLPYAIGFGILWLIFMMFFN